MRCLRLTLAVAKRWKIVWSLNKHNHPFPQGGWITKWSFMIIIVVNVAQRTAEQWCFQLAGEKRRHKRWFARTWTFQTRVIVFDKSGILIKPSIIVQLTTAGSWWILIGFFSGFCVGHITILRTFDLPQGSGVALTTEMLPGLSVWV